MVIAIIGILSTTLAPKLRRTLAKAKDAKAIAVLGAARTAGSIAVTDSMVKNKSGTITITFEDITSRLDSKTNECQTYKIDKQEKEDTRKQVKT